MPSGHSSQPAFAADRATSAYYEQRAREYDDWYTGQGVFARRQRPGWSEEVDRLVELVGRLPARRTLDVACGTGFLTRHLCGYTVGVDQSSSMVQIAQSRMAGGLAILGDALHLPVADNSFERLFTAHFYGHLPPNEREAFLAEARRIAAEIVVVDSAPRAAKPAEGWEERILNDGSRHRVFKRYLSAEQLAAELDGEVLMAGRWFVTARAVL